MTAAVVTGEAMMVVSVGVMTVRLGVTGEIRRAADEESNRCLSLKGGNRHPHKKPCSLRWARLFNLRSY